MALRDDVIKAYNRLRQFGRLDFGRIFGTAGRENGRYRAMMGLFERSFAARVELNALVSLLVDRGVFTADEWLLAQKEEAAYLLELLAKEWPEVEIHSDGFVVKDVKALHERSKREGWPA